MNIPLEGITLSSGFLVWKCNFFFSFFSFSIPLSPVAVLDTNAFEAEMLFGVESQILTVMERTCFTQPPKELFLKAKKFVVLDRVMERKLVILELVDLAEVGAGR